MTADASPFPDYLNLVQSAAVLGINPQSLRRLIKRGQVPHQLVHGSYLINRYDLMQFKANYDPRPGVHQVPLGRLL